VRQIVIPRFGEADSLKYRHRDVEKLGAPGWNRPRCLYSEGEPRLDIS
jgi:hypothetical protein